MHKMNKQEIYISKEERVSVTYAGHSDKYGACERTGADGDIYHYRGETRTTNGGWNEVFSMFVTSQYLIKHLNEYSRIRWKLDNENLTPWIQE